MNIEINTINKTITIIGVSLVKEVIEFITKHGYEDYKLISKDNYINIGIPYITDTNPYKITYNNTYSFI